MSPYDNWMLSHMYLFYSRESIRQQDSARALFVIKVDLALRSSYHARPPNDICAVTMHARSSKQITVYVVAAAARVSGSRPPELEICSWMSLKVNVVYVRRFAVGGTVQTSSTGSFSFSSFTMELFRFGPPGIEATRLCLLSRDCPLGPLGIVSEVSLMAPVRDGPLKLDARCRLAPSCMLSTLMRDCVGVNPCSMPISWKSRMLQLVRCTLAP